MSAQNAKKTYFLIIKVVCSAGILIFLFKQIDIGLFASQLKNINTFMFFLAFLILFLQCTLSSLKWKIILTAEKSEIPFAYLLENYLIGNFISLFLPSSFGGDIYRVYSLRKYDLDTIKSASSVLFDRFSGLFALASISIISFSIFYREIIDFKFLILYMVGVLSFWFLSTNRILSILSKIQLRPFNIVIRIFNSFNRYRVNKTVFTLSLVISFIFQSNIVLLNKLYCDALNIDIPLSFLYIVIPMIYLTEAIPIAINGLGLREGAFVFFFYQGGYGKEEGLAVALLVITIRYMFTMMVGGSMFLKMMFFVNKHKRLDGRVPRKQIP